jgi:TRAP-type C4-dicarboxylate transport system substrate-binding protein
LEYAGAVPVQSSLPDAYTSMKTGVYNGWIMFPDAWVSLKLYEPGPYYTEIGFGAITWHGLTINNNTWAKLPEDVQSIMMEVAKDFEEQTAIVNEANYDNNIEELKTLGTTVRTLPDDVRASWADSLKEWPQVKATELDGQGLPGSEVLKLTLEAAEKAGYTWPNRYEIK